MTLANITAQDFVGTPYAKYDCFALVREVADKLFGLKYPTLLEYSDTPQLVVAEQLTSSDWLEVEKGEAGDVVLLSTTQRLGSHVGILLDSKWVLHNDKKYGCIIQDFRGLYQRGFKHYKIYRWAK